MDATQKTKNKQNIREITGSGFTWIDVRRPNRQTLKELQKRLPFLRDEDLDDCLPPFERPKLIDRDNYLFLVLLYPVYDRTRRSIRPTEVDFFVGKDFLVMSHQGVLPEIDRMSHRRAIGVSPARLVVELAHDLVVSRFPLLTDISNELLEVEERLFREGNGDLIRDILRVRNNILGFREAMQGHAALFRKLTTRGEGIYDAAGLKADCDELVTHIEDIWNFLSNDKETAEALYDSHLSLMTLKTNHAIKNLTGLAFIVFPMTLVAAIFSMRAEHMPISGSPLDFWIMLGVVFGTMAVTAGYLRWKKWM